MDRYGFLFLPNGNVSIYPQVLISGIQVNAYGVLIAAMMKHCSGSTSVADRIQTNIRLHEDERMRIIMTPDGERLYDPKPSKKNKTQFRMFKSHKGRGDRTHSEAF